MMMMIEMIFPILLFAAGNPVVRDFEKVDEAAVRLKEEQKEALKNELTAKIVEVRTLWKQARTKEYHGDFATILKTRIADVNDVIVQIDTARKTAQQLTILCGDPNETQRIIQRALSTSLGEPIMQMQLSVMSFLEAAEIAIADQAAADPNDLEEQRRLADFQTAALTLALQKMKEKL